MAGTRLSGGGEYDKGLGEKEKGSKSGKGSDASKVLGSMLDQMRPLPPTGDKEGKKKRKKKGSDSDSDEPPKKPKEKEKDKARPNHFFENSQTRKTKLSRKKHRSSKTKRKSTS